MNRLGIATALLFVACGQSRGTGPGDDLAGIDLAGVDFAGVDFAGSSSGDMPTGFSGSIYAHSDVDLYRIDSDLLTVTKVAAFVWPMGADQMTDIALDKNGNMVGISKSRVYSVDPTTANCTFLANFSGGNFNGLSFIAPDPANPNAAEILVGAALDGSIIRIDPMTGMQTPLGNYGNLWGSSGDIVSVEGATYATVHRFIEADTLVSVDPKTGAATPIGSTGFNDIWGLGYWKQRVFGFTKGGDFVLIDIKTGAATKVQSSAVSWWGAGVSTSAPITPIQ